MLDEDGSTEEVLSAFDASFHLIFKNFSSLGVDSQCITFTNGSYLF